MMDQTVSEATRRPGIAGLVRDLNQTSVADADLANIALAANAMNLRLQAIGRPAWGPQDAQAFLTILRTLAKTVSGLEHATEASMHHPALSEQQRDASLDHAAQALSADAA